MFNNDGVERSGRGVRLDGAQWTVMGAVGAIAVGSLIYRWLMGERLGHSAAMFVGLPAVLAILLAATPNAKSATGAILKGITLMLLVAAPLLGEGWLCILIASPLFYLVGVVVGLIMDKQRERLARRGIRMSCAVAMLLPMSLEGVVPQWTFPREQTVEARRVVAAPADAVERALAGSPDVRFPLPAAIAAGFPHPMAAWGEGLRVGDTRTVHFSGAEGDPEGDLTTRVTASRPGFVRTETVSDGSKLTQWVRWTSNEVSWRAIDREHTEVVWRIKFERELDPAWYFTPLERGAVHEAAEWMIAANATPRER